MAEPLTLVEKIATAHAVGLRPGEVVRAGDIVTIRPKHIMTHDNTSAVIPKFTAIGATSVHDPRQPVFAIDHDIQNRAPTNLAKYAGIEAFALQHGIDFYPPGSGISHQVMVEQGYVTPGSMVVASDSHSNIYGALGCLGTPVVRTDAAALWATGVTWWQAPRVARCMLTGALSPGVVGKDVIIALCGLFNQDDVLNMAVEFVGDGIACLTMDQRLSIANMTTEWGAMAGIFPFDDTLHAWLIDRAAWLAARGTPRLSRADVERWWDERATWRADPGAHYAVDLTLDLTTVIPHVAGPDDVKTMTALPAIERQHIAITKAYLVSCVNARSEDLAAAAAVLKGQHVAPGVAFYVAAASAEVQRAAEASGDWQTLLQAGARPLPSGCGPCIGLGEGLLEPGDVGISATNRTFKGRMGSREARAYLASPAVVAASAAAGYIRGPSEFAAMEPRFTVVRHADPARSAGPVAIVPGFPPRVECRALWLPADNITTDGVYPGSLTYRDDVPPAEMAAAAFSNYDPAFHHLAPPPGPGDVIVAGSNFGAGSSREQAATCLLHLGLHGVIAASFSETYKRNAFNNGLIVFECPALVDDLRSRLGDGALTIAGPVLTIDYARSAITCGDREYAFPPLSPTAQVLVAAGGAENVVRRRLAAAEG
ncbi:MAG: homoaconitase [Chloroflexi bacterium]|nr:homoaconitase [Chloroflexota bacterium]